MSQNAEVRLISTLKRFCSGTFLSRLTGVAREVSMAFFFGTSPLVASFWVAFRSANLFRRLFGEGGLNVAFIPHYTSLYKEDQEKAHSFFATLSTSLGFFLFVLVAIAEVVLAFFMENEVVRLTMLLLPALPFISLYALNSALLNTRGIYFLPSVAPAVANLVWVAALFLFRNSSMTTIAMAVVFGIALQWILTAYPAYFPLKKTAPLAKREIISFMRPFALTLIGVTAQQLNSTLDGFFAKWADPEGPAYLWYALRIEQLPMAFFGVGFMSALLPPISRASEEEFLRLLSFSLKKALSLLLPLTCGLFVMALSSIHLLFGQGAFQERSILNTTLCLWAYAPSLLFASLSLLLAAAFYAKKEFKIPTLLSLASVGLNLILNSLFVFLFQWGAVSIALATSLASLMNAALLGHFLHKRYPGWERGIVSSALRVLLISLGAATCTLFVLQHGSISLILGESVHLPANKWLPVVTESLLYGGLLLALAKVFKVNEILVLVGKKVADQRNIERNS